MRRDKITAALPSLGAVTGLALLASATILVIALILASVSHGNQNRVSMTGALGGAGTHDAMMPAALEPARARRNRERDLPRRLAAETPPPASASVESDEELMTRLRALAGRDPEQILRLAREANAREPDGPNAPERAWMVVKSLADLQRFSEAKDEAQAMVNRYPGTSWALDVQRHLLSNPL